MALGRAEAGAHEEKLRPARSCCSHLLLEHTVGRPPHVRVVITRARGRKDFAPGCLYALCVILVHLPDLGFQVQLALLRGDLAGRSEELCDVFLCF